MSQDSNKNEEFRKRVFSGCLILCFNIAFIAGSTYFWLYVAGLTWWQMILLGIVFNTLLAGIIKTATKTDRKSRGEYWRAVRQQEREQSQNLTPPVENSPGSPPEQ